tara:strand:+ start:721 stop:1395 length:675 start_codon:yes stop_codon:yes gene_type:complete
MGITVALNILEHLPSLSFFQMAKGCDVLLLRDDFYYKHHFYHNRTRIVTKSGAKWVEVTVVVPEYKTPINQIKTGGHWKEVYRKRMIKAYSNHLHFESQMPLVNKVLDLHSIKLGDYNYYFMKQIIKWLHLPYEVKRVTGTPDTDIAEHGFQLSDVLSHYNAKTLIVTPREYRYIKLKNNIDISCITPQVAEYPQKGQAEFINNVSIIDALMNIGAKQTRKLLV